MTARHCFVAASLVVCLAAPAFSLEADGASQLPPSTAAAAAPNGVVVPAPASVVTRDADGRVVVRATRLVEPLVMDGSLDETAYGTIAPISEFFQQVPHDGAPATEKTEVWVFFDSNSIYVTARCWDSAPPGEWVANDYRRDSFQMKQNDTFGVSFDTFFDRRNGFVFYTNPLGARVDYAVVDEGTNFDWNPVWEAHPGRFEGGWTVEMRVPFKSLRYKSGHDQLWGMQLRRVVRRKNEWAYISRVPQSAAGPNGLTRVSYGATLTGLDLPDMSRAVEVKPYAIARVTTDRTRTPPIENEKDPDVGIDAKYSVTANLTADFTYNTDFAQVEVDEQQVNLTRFSLVFPEKREFFLEGKGLFDFGRTPTGNGSGGTSNAVPNLFFTRRIGLEGGRTIPVTYGGRLTGKTGGYGIGLLTIQTDDEPSLGVKATNFTVVRLKRDVLRRSSVGAIFTNRSISPRHGGQNQAYGLDATFSFYDSIAVSGYYARTSTDGLAGDNASYQARFQYNADRYGMTVDHLLVGEHFNPEIGYLQRTDFRRTYSYLRFSPRPRNVPHVRKLTTEGSVEYILGGDGGVESREQQARFLADFHNGDQFTAQVTRSYERLQSPFEIARGIVIPVGGYDFHDVQASYLLGVQHRANGTVTVQRGTFYGGTITALTLTTARVGITPHLSFDPGVSLSHVQLPQGDFTLRLLSTRIDYAFTPRMFASGLLQFSAASHRFSSNLRYRWEYRPGSELFVVYTDERDTTTHPLDPRLRNRAFVVKVNRLLQF